MDELQKKADFLISEVQKAAAKLDIDRQAVELAELNKASARSDFWQDSAKAQAATKQQAHLQARIEPWQKLQQDLAEIADLLALKDKSLEAELAKQLDATERKFSQLKSQLKLAGPYDDHNAIISLHAGAGGTDAQDWTQMLLRMYVRWAEAQGLKTKIIEESGGEEAGLKSATLEIDGDFAYGRLHGEHGVHRLVRLSPFNADNLRQTSFAKVEVMPKIDQPGELAIDDKDLKVDVYRSGGHGGQSVNTTDSAVRVAHIPSGLSVAIQNERSQLQNKETALTILRSRLAQLQLEQHQEQLDKLKGPNQAAEWGNQIRSYVLHPYKQVKDLRTKHQSKDPTKVLDGDLEPFIEAYLEHRLS